MHAQQTHILIRPLSLICLIIPVIAVAALLLSCEHSPVQNDNPPPTKPAYYLATGTPNGAYVLLGAALRGASEDLNIIPCTTEGSMENLHLLRDNKVQFAIVQMDSLHDVLNSSEHGAGPTDDNTLGNPSDADTKDHAELEHDIFLVSYLYSEKLHLFLRPHLYLSSPAELNGLSDKSRVWLGPVGSGSYNTALRVLEASGLSEKEIGSFESANKAENKRNTSPPSRYSPLSVKMDWNIASDRILHSSSSDGLDAYFRVMAVAGTQPPSQPKLEPCPASKRAEAPAYSAPGPSTETLLAGDVRLIGLPQNVIDHMTEDKLYVPTTIDLNSYHNLKRGVATIGVAAVLVTHLPETQVEPVASIIKTIANKKSQIEQEIGGIKLDQFDATVSQGELGGHIHKGARSHLQPSRHYAIWWCSMVMVLGLFVAVIVRNPAKFRQRVARASYALLLMTILSVIFVLTSIAMMHSEGRLNPDFASFKDSISNTLAFVVGLKQDYHPMTRDGENDLWAALFLLPMVFGWLTSDVVRAFLRNISAQLEQKIANGHLSDVSRRHPHLGKVVRKCPDMLTSVVLPPEGSTREQATSLANDVGQPRVRLTEDDRVQV